MKQVEVGAANRRAGNSDDRIGWFGYFGIGDFLESDFANVFVDDRFQSSPPRA